MHHRGPDDRGIRVDASGRAILGHTRLSIIDLSAAGHQPMANAAGTRWIVFNGEIYNYRELRKELSNYPYRGDSDTEVILAAYERWGEFCLDRFIGMFSFLLWDSEERSLFGARDRFGVKPLFYRMFHDQRLAVASEIKAIGAACNQLEPDERTWAGYLAHGHQDISTRTFWKDVESLPPGHSFHWRDGAMRTHCWYDVANRVGESYDRRPEAEVLDEYSSLLTESIGLRFRSDVPVGINLSGGLDSSILLGLVQRDEGDESSVRAYTFVTGDAAYDELPWVQQMLAQTKHPLTTCRLDPSDVPALAQKVQDTQDEPYGGLPTLAYARLFETARANGSIVLLDGQGMDEQWAGYDYYAKATEPNSAGVVQGTTERPVRPECLSADFLPLAATPSFPAPFADRLRNMQYRDLRFTKLPRALRFNDRASMMSSTELREPFLDHRLVELAFRQPADRKIGDGRGKRLLRDFARDMLPITLTEAPKRAVQTPQREWLRGPLRVWATAMIELALENHGGSWLRSDAIRSQWRDYCAGAGDNSFYIWQWVSLGMMSTVRQAEVAHV